MILFILIISYLSFGIEPMPHNESERLCSQPTAFQTDLFLSVNGTEVIITGTATNPTNISHRIALSNKPIFVKTLCDDGTIMIDLTVTNPDGVATYNLSSLSSCSNCTIVYFIFCPDTSNDSVLRECLNVDNTVILPTVVPYKINYTLDVKSYRYCPPTTAEMPKEACMLIMLMFGILGGAIYLSGSSPFRFFSIPRMRMPKTRMYQVKPKSISFTMMSVSSIAGSVAGKAVKVLGKGIKGVKKLIKGDKGDKKSENEAKAGAQQQEPYQPKTIFGKITKHYAGFVGMINYATKSTIGKIDITGRGRLRSDPRMAATGMTAFIMESDISYGGRRFSSDVTKADEVIVAMVKKILLQLLQVVLPRILGFTPLTAALGASLRGISEFLNGVADGLDAVGLTKAAEFLRKASEKIVGTYSLWGLLDKLEDKWLGRETRKGMNILEEMAKDENVKKALEDAMKDGKMSDEELKNINKLSDGKYNLEFDDKGNWIVSKKVGDEWESATLTTDDLRRILRTMPPGVSDEMRKLIEVMMSLSVKAQFLNSIDVDKLGEIINEHREKYRKAKNKKEKNKVLKKFKKKLRGMGLNADDPNSVGFEFAELAVKAVMGVKDQNGKEITAEKVTLAIREAKESLDAHALIVGVLVGNALLAAEEIRRLHIGEQASIEEIEDAEKRLEDMKQELRLREALADEVKSADDLVDLATAIKAKEEMALAELDGNEELVKKYKRALRNNKFAKYSLEELRTMKGILKERLPEGMDIAENIAEARLGIKEVRNSKVLRQRLESIMKTARESDVLEYGIKDTREAIKEGEKSVKYLEAYAKGRNKIVSKLGEFNQKIEEVKEEIEQARQEKDVKTVEKLTEKLNKLEDERKEFIDGLKERFGEIVVDLADAKGKKVYALSGELAGIQEVMSEYSELMGTEGTPVDSSGTAQYLEMNKSKILAAAAAIGYFDSALFGTAVIEAVGNKQKTVNQMNDLLREKQGLEYQNELIKQKITENMEYLGTPMKKTVDIQNIQEETTEMKDELRANEERIAELETQITEIKKENPVLEVDTLGTVMATTYNMTSDSPLEGYTDEEKMKVITSNAFNEGFAMYTKNYIEITKELHQLALYGDYIGYMDKNGYGEFTQSILNSAEYYTTYSQEMKKLTKNFQDNKNDVLNQVDSMKELREETIKTIASPDMDAYIETKQKIENLKTEISDLQTKINEKKEEIAKLEEQMKLYVGTPTWVEKNKEMQKLNDEIKSMEMQLEEKQEQLTLEERSVGFTSINEKFNSLNKKFEDIITKAKQIMGIETVERPTREHAEEDWITRAYSVADAIEYKTESFKEYQPWEQWNLALENQLSNIRNIIKGIKSIRKNLPTTDEGRKTARKQVMTMADIIIESDKVRDDLMSALYYSENPINRNVLQGFGSRLGGRRERKEDWLKSVTDSVRNITDSMTKKLHDTAKIARMNLGLLSGKEENKENIDNTFKDLYWIQAGMHELEEQSTIFVSVAKSPASSWREWAEVGEGWVRGVSEKRDIFVERWNKKLEEKSKEFLSMVSGNKLDKYEQKTKQTTTTSSDSAFETSPTTVTGYDHNRGEKTNKEQKTEKGRSKKESNDKGGDNEDKQ